MYQQALHMLPALRQDMGSLCDVQVRGRWAGHGAAVQAVQGPRYRPGSPLSEPLQVEEGPQETLLSVSRCAYHELFTQVWHLG